MSMDVLVRLYVRHDTDLLNLYHHPDFSLASAMRDSLIAYVRNEPVKYIMPRPYKDNPEKRRNVSVHLYFHSQEDEDIEEFLRGVREGARCALIKNILRGYMMYPNIYGYCEDQDKSVKHALSVYGKTAQKTEETGQEFIRGRGNRGKRRTIDENHEKPVSDSDMSTSNTGVKETQTTHNELLDLNKEINKNEESADSSNIQQDTAVPINEASMDDDDFDEYLSRFGDWVDNLS